MYNINWPLWIFQRIPKYVRKPIYTAFLTVLIKPVINLHAAFVMFRNGVLSKVQYTGQTIYLERLLNDTYSPALRDIYINTVADDNSFVIYNKVEVQPPVFFYSKWSSSVSYAILDRSIINGNVYRSLTANLNAAPATSTSDWALESAFQPMFNLLEFQYMPSFVVYVRTTFTQTIQLTATVNSKRIAGKLFTVQTY